MGGKGWIHFIEGISTLDQILHGRMGFFSPSTLVFSGIQFWVSGNERISYDTYIIGKIIKKHNSPFFRLWQWFIFAVFYTPFKNFFTALTNSIMKLCINFLKNKQKNKVRISSVSQHCKPQEKGTWKI